MRGVLGGSKPNKPAVPYPRPAQPLTKRDVERMAYEQAGAIDLLKAIRNTPTDFERTLTALRATTRLADVMTRREQLEFQAAVSGLPSGRTAGTVPERLVAAWLVTHNYSYGGSGYVTDATKDWFFQLPLFGGRQYGGAVVDIFVSAGASHTEKGLAIRVNGQYWHTGAEVEAKDEAQKQRLINKGVAVEDIFDYQVMDPGLLDTTFNYLLGGKKV